MATIQPAETPPATEKGRQTRRRIIDAAADLIYERGVATVTLDEVGRATCTSRSQMYHYFTDKADLVRAVIDCQRDRIAVAHRPTLTSLSMWSDLDQWSAMIVKLQRGLSCRGGCPLGSLANELAELDELGRRHLVDAFEVWEQMLADGLANMRQRGELRDDADPARLAMGVMASLQGGLLLAKTTRDIHRLEVALASAIGYVKTFSS